MVDDNKIRYSDIIQPDDSIDKLIQQLERLTSTYESMLESMRTGANKMSQSLKQASGATSEGRAAIEETAAATKRLKKAQEEVDSVLGATSKAVTELRTKTAENNKATAETGKMAKTLASSYANLNRSLGASVRQWNSLSKEEQNNEETGGKLLDNILRLKEQVLVLTSSLKPLIESYNIQENAIEKLTAAAAKHASLQGEEGKALLGTIRETEYLTEAYRQQLNVETQLARAQARKEQLYTDEYEQLVSLRGELSQETKLRELDIQLAKAAPGSYNQLSLQYRRNKLELNAMGAEMRNTTEYGKNLEKETLELYKRMVALQEATGNHKLSVGNYTKAWDGLGFSISQVVRELPNAAIGMNTFFLAISNNIPIVVDEIKKLKEANAAAVAAGKPTKSIIGSITSALFSWHTALIVGITILTNYGDEIWEWAKNLIKGKDAVMSLAEAQKNIQKELKDTNGDYGKSIVTLKNLQREWGNLKTAAEKNQWIRDNKSEFDKLDVSVRNVAEADRLLINQTGAFITALQLRARATAAQKLAVDEYERVLQLQADIEDKYKDYKLGSFDPSSGEFSYDKELDARIQAERKRLEGSAVVVGSNITGTFTQTAPQTSALEMATIQIRSDLEDYNEALTEANTYFELQKQFEEKIEKTLKDAGLEPKHKKEPGSKKEPKDLSDKIAKDSLKIRKKYEASETRLIDDELEQRKAKAADSRRAESRELMVQLANNERLLKANETAKNGIFEMGGKKYKQLTEDQVKAVERQQELIRETILKNNEFIAKEDEKFALEKQKRDLEIEQEAINLQLDAVKKGSEEEINLRLQALENERKLALIANSLLPEGQRQSEEAINSSFIAKQLQLLGELDLTAFEERQKTEEESFNATKHTEREKTIFMLQQERDRWKYLITLAEQGSLQWSDEQIKAAKAAVKGIDNELGDITGVKGVIGDIADKGLGGTLLSRLGFDEEGIQAFNEATDTIISNLQSIMEAEIQLAEAAVEAAQERADSAKSALDAEIEARNKGYANNVATARKEYEQEKKRVADQQKLLQQAKRRQEALDTAMQTSSLITASANIWKSMSEVPIVGPALALAAIASMWASFAVSKVKARQVTAAESQQYGEGGLEFLEGGSHASGNDIDLATKNRRGRNMRAEGGEALAIINKRNTKRYRKQLPGIIESLNKGTFEDKYLSAFDAGENVMLNIASTQKAVDLTKLESYTEKISKQGEIQRFNLLNGSILVVNKNVRRIIKP